MITYSENILWIYKLAKQFKNYRYVQKIEHEQTQIEIDLSKLNEQELIEFLQVNMGFENNPETPEKYEACFKLYLYVRTGSRKVADGFRAGELLEYFNNKISISDTYNTILEEVKKLKNNWE